MTSTSSAPPAPGSSGGGLPPTLPPGFDTPAPGSTTGGGSTTNPTTPAPTAGTSTSFVPTTNTTTGGPNFIPAPGGCTTPPIPGKDPMQVPSQTSGGGAVAGVNGEALKPVLEQLTKVIGQLQGAVGGVAGGGAPGKTPDQGAPKTPAQDAAQGGGNVAGANGGGPAQKGAEVAGANGGGPAQKACDMPGHKDATQGGGPSASTVAGANGTGGADASKGATQVNGATGGGPAANEALVKALQGVIEALNALVKALGGSTIAGGPGGKDPAQKSPEQKPPTPPPSEVHGDHGPGKGKDPSQVNGDQGPGQKPEQKPPVPTPPPAPTPPPPPTDVAGDQGPGQDNPQQVVQQTPPPKPSEVSPANGGPKPEQKPPTPEQKPPTKPKPPTVAQGNVILDNDDDRWSAKLTAKGKGKDGDSSVELWGDPHVVATIDGKTEKFDIGYGAGKVTLFDGTVVSWDTYDKGHKNQFILRDFKVDSPGTKFDQSVTTRDRDGDKGDQMNLKTALTEAHLKELAIALETMKGPMDKPLQNGTWTSPQYKNPNQVGQGNTAQQSA